MCMYIYTHIPTHMYTHIISIIYTEIIPLCNRRHWNTEVLVEKVKTIQKPTRRHTEAFKAEKHATVTNEKTSFLKA